MAGLRVRAYRLGIYVLTGLISGFAGLVLMSRLGSGQPTAGAGLELSSIAAVVLGGTRITGGQGTLIGTFLGALLITILGNGLDLLNVGSFYQLIFVELVLLVCGRHFQICRALKLCLPFKRQEHIEILWWSQGRTRKCLST